MRKGHMDQGVGQSLTAAEPFYSLAAEASSRPGALTLKHQQTKTCDSSLDFPIPDFDSCKYI
jgi:hypothetical protein